MNRRVTKATTKKRIGALKINIKKTVGQSEQTSYRLYKVRVKGRPGWKQPTFHNLGSGLDVVGHEKMERDSAILIPEVPEGPEVLDFQWKPGRNNRIHHISCSPPWQQQLQIQKNFVSTAITDDELLVGLVP